MRSDDQGFISTLEAKPDVSLTEVWYLPRITRFTSLHFGYVYLSVNEGLTLANYRSYPDQLCCNLYFDFSGQKFFLAKHISGLFSFFVPTNTRSYLEGNIKVDADADCSTEAQMPVRNRNVEAIGNKFILHNFGSWRPYISFWTPAITR